MAYAPPQALLKRRPGTTKEEFRKYYIEHHGRLVLPLFIDLGVRSYSQVHNPIWASPRARDKYPDIDLADWDAVAECVFPPSGPPSYLLGRGAESWKDDSVSSAVVRRYYRDVVLPDERLFLTDESAKHMRLLEPGSVVGEKVEFIVDGGVVVELEEWEWATKVWEGVEREVRGEVRGEVRKPLEGWREGYEMKWT